VVAVNDGAGPSSAVDAVIEIAQAKAMYERGEFNW
jgi:hypothetical protein